MKPPSTARTAGRSGGCGGACDASPLSCFLFRPRKSCKKRRKRSHTNVFNTLVTRTSIPPAQTAHVRFHERKWYTLGFRRRIAHSGSHGETRAFRTGPLSLPSTRTARSRTSPGRVSERRTLPLWDLGREVLSKNAESLRDSDALMRVAVPRRRGPAGLRDLFRFCRSCGLYTLRSVLSECARRGVVSLPSACFTCC